VSRKQVSIIALKGTLAILIFCNFFVWGGPALLGNESLAALIQIPYPSEMTYYLRMVGVLTITFGFVYLPAFFDPAKYSVLVSIAILDTGLTAVVSLLWLIENEQEQVPLFWVTTFICLILMTSCLYFHPSRWPNQKFQSGARKDFGQ